jgi:hypothetical protein
MSLRWRVPPALLLTRSSASMRGDCHISHELAKNLQISPSMIARRFQRHSPRLTRLVPQLVEVMVTALVIDLSGIVTKLKK